MTPRVHGSSVSSSSLASDDEGSDDRLGHVCLVAGLVVVPSAAASSPSDPSDPKGPRMRPADV
jgi:hypothetical protein